MRTSKSRFALLLLLVLLAPATLDAAERRGDQVATPTATGAPVNINTASVKELMTLEGVGQKVAEKVVEYRTANGPFRKPEEIRKVQGIGPGLWEKNRQRVVVK